MFSTFNNFSSLVNKNSIVIPRTLTANTILIVSPTDNKQSGVRNGSMTNDGEYIIIPSSGDSLIISTNGGNTWQSMESELWGINTFRYVPGYSERMLSEDKQTFYFYNNMPCSSNGGLTWTYPTAYRISAAMSENAEYMYYVSDENLWRSTNKGVTFTAIGGRTVANNNGLINNIGYYRRVSVSPSGRIVAFSDASYGVYISTDYGQSFTYPPGFKGNANTGGAGEYISLTEGATLMAGTKYSTNYGQTVVRSFLENNGVIGSGVMLSSDGTSLFYSRINAVEYLYTTNAGVTMNTFIPFSSGAQNQGANIVAQRNDSITSASKTFYGFTYLRQNDGGINMSLVYKVTNGCKTLKFVGPNQLNKNGMVCNYIGSNAVSMSSTGRFILVGSNRGAPYNILSLSSDSGVSWVPLNWNNPEGGWPLSTVNFVLNPSCAYVWQSTCMSSNGQYMIASSSAPNAYVFLSNTYGGIFGPISGPGNTTGLPTSTAATWSWSSISDDGSTILLVANTLSVYLSTNSGVSFTTLGTTNGLPAATSAWNFCAMGYTNTNYMLVSSTTVGLYMSTNKGTSWSKIDGTGNTRGLPTAAAASYTSLSISNDGSKMCVIQNGVYYSSNNGANWARLDGTGNTTGLATAASSTYCITGLSGDGTKILTGIPGAAAYLSTNSGTSFTILNTATTVNSFPNSGSGTYQWGQMAISNNNQQLYVNMGTGLIFCYDGLGLMWCSTNWNVDSRPAAGLGFCGAPRRVSQTVKMSKDGNIVLAPVGASNTHWVTLTISYDGGYSYNLIANRGHFNARDVTSLSPYWSTWCLSHTGQYMLLAEISYYNLYLSSNYGLTFVVLGGPKTTSAGISVGLPSNNTTTGVTWNGSVMSQYGEVIIVNASQGCYLSTNTGGSFTQIAGTRGLGTSASNSFTAFPTCSNNGSIIINDNTTTRILYLSINTGTSWTAIGGTTNTSGLPATTNLTWFSAISKSTGQYILVAVQNGGLYLSTNTGTTFTQISGIANSRGLPTVSSNWSTCDTNANGSYMVAAVSAGRLYYSTNYGVTWVTYVYSERCVSQNLNYYFVTMSDTGSKIYVVSSYSDPFIITLT